MKAWLIKHGGPLVAALALASLLTSVVWWRVGPEADPIMRIPTGVAYTPLVVPRLPASDGGWREPIYEPSGWSYDLFTPPAIEYDMKNGCFALRPTLPLPSEKGGKGEVELLAVRPELFRLQLMGYVGEPGNYRAMLVTPYGFETWLARPGQHFAELGLVLKSIDVRTEGVGDVVARAVLWDERAGAEVTLDNRGSRLAGTWLAEVRHLIGPQKSRLVRVGEMMAIGENSARVENIRLQPPEVTLSLVGAGGRVVVLRTAEIRGLPLPRPVATQAANAPSVK